MKNNFAGKYIKKRLLIRNLFITGFVIKKNPAVAGDSN